MTKSVLYSDISQEPPPSCLVLNKPRVGIMSDDDARILSWEEDTGFPLTNSISKKRTGSFKSQMKVH